MAEIRAFPKSGANILGGLAQGAQIAGGIQNIQASRANVQLQQQAAQQQAQQQQFAQEQVVKQQEQAKLTTQLDRYDNLWDKGIKAGYLKSNPEFMESLSSQINTTSSELFPGSPNMDFNKILNNSQQFEKDWNAYQLMEKEGMHEEAQQFFEQALPNYAQDPVASKAIQEQLAAGQRQQQAAGLPFKEVFGATAPFAKQAFVSGEPITKILPKPSSRALIVKDIEAGKGKVQTVAIDPNTGTVVKKYGTAQPKFKPTKGTPFKEGQVRFWKVDESGEPVEFRTIKSIDGQISEKSVNDLLNEGFVTEKFLSSQQGTVIKFEGFGQPTTKGEGGEMTGNMTEKGEPGEMTEPGEIGEMIPSFEEYKNDLKANTSNLTKTGKLKWSDKQLRDFYAEDFGANQ